jgi:6-phospho-3-hexuloisomerase
MSDSKDFRFNIYRFSEPCISYFQRWIREVREDLLEQSEEVQKFTDYFIPRDGETPRNIEIHIAGKGRSRIVGRNASVRLVNAGYTVYDEMDELTPPIGRDEKGIRFISYNLSGGGKTEPVVNAAKVAKTMGVPVLAITSTDPSPLADIADSKIVTKGRTKEDVEKEEVLGIIKEAAGYLGSESEFKNLITSELVVNYLYKRLGLTEKDARAGHKKREI